MVRVVSTLRPRLVLLGKMDDVCSICRPLSLPYHVTVPSFERESKARALNNREPRSKEAQDRA